MPKKKKKSKTNETVKFHSQDEISTTEVNEMRTSEADSSSTWSTSDSDNEFVELSYLATGTTATDSTTDTANTIDNTSTAKDSIDDITTVDELKSTATSHTESHPTTDYSSYVIPLKIILPLEHVHAPKEDGSYDRYNYILLRTDDVAHHEHIYSDNPDVLIPVHANQHRRMPSFMESGGSTSTKTTMMDDDGLANADDESTTGIVESMTSLTNKTDADNSLVLSDAIGFKYGLGRHYQILDEMKNIVVEFDDVIVARTQQTDSSTIDDVDTEHTLSFDEEEQTRALSSVDAEIISAHYQKLYQWLNW